MRKLIHGPLRLLITASLVLSGCALRPCQHTTTGCQTDNKEKDKPCRKFGGPTTGCEQSLDRCRFGHLPRLSSCQDPANRSAADSYPAGDLEFADAGTMQFPDLRKRE
jgi:hypothetical protein